MYLTKKFIAILLMSELFCRSFFTYSQ